MKEKLEWIWIQTLAFFSKIVLIIIYWLIKILSPNLLEEK